MRRRVRVVEVGWRWRFGLLGKKELVAFKPVWVGIQDIHDSQVNELLDLDSNSICC